MQIFFYFHDARVVIVENNISPLSKFPMIGLLDPLPSAIALYYRLNILGTNSDSLIIKSFSLRIMLWADKSFDNRPEMLIFGPSSHGSVQ